MRADVITRSVRILQHNERAVLLSDFETGKRFAVALARVDLDIGTGGIASVTMPRDLAAEVGVA